MRVEGRGYGPGGEAEEGGGAGERSESETSGARLPGERLAEGREVEREATGPRTTEGQR